MKKVSRLLGIVIMGLVLTGCLDTKQEFWLNPDGTGKVRVEAVLSRIDLGGGQDADPEVKAKSTVLDELQKAEGVEVWSDVAYEALDDGQVKFQGTAYFTDISQLRFHNAGMKLSLYDTIDVQSQSGQTIVTISSSDKDKKKKAQKPKQLTEEEIDAEIRKAKAEFGKMSMMLNVMATLRIQRIVHTSGAVQSVTNMEKLSDQSVAFDFRGEKMIEVFNQLIEDEDYMREMLRAGRHPVKDGPEGDDQFNQMIFGEAAPVTATFAGSESNLFDYRAEVAAATAPYAALVEELGGVQKIKAPEGVVGKFKVGGVRMIHYSDNERGIRPFNFDKGYTLALYGILPRPVISVNEGIITEAKDDHGRDLLPESEWNRRISFPNLGKDQQTVSFDVNLELPSASATRISSLRGTLTYMVSEDVKSVDLGINDFSVGVEGDHFGAKIVSIEESNWQPGKQTMQVRVAIKKEMLKEARIYDAAGNQLETSGGYSSMGDVTTFNYTLKDGEFPASGRIEYDVYEGAKEYELPFELKEIPLTGR